MHTSGAPRQSVGTGGLDLCRRCQGIFPRGDMHPGEGGLLCGACHIASQTERIDGPDGRPDVVGMSPLKRQVWFAKYTGLRQQANENPSDVSLLVEMASVGENLGLTLEAIDHLQRVVELAPDHLEAAARLKALKRQASATGETGETWAAEMPRRKPAPAVAPFWEDIPGLLAYPFNGKGTAVLAAASIFLAVTDVMSQINLVGAIVALCLWGYVAAYQFDAIASAGAGKKEPPEFPEVFSLLDAMVFPFFAYLACVVVSFVPCMFVAWFTLNGTLAPSLGTVLMLLTFAFGFFVFPMTLMVRGLTKETSGVANPGFVLGSIGRIFPDYLAAFCSLSVLWVLYVVASSVTLFAVSALFGSPTADAVLHADWIRVIGWFIFTLVKWPILLYAVLVQSCLLGRLYRQGAERLAWFTQATEATKRAAKAGAGLWCAAALCVALVCGGAWLSVQMIQAVAGGGGIVAAAENPVMDGGKLVYYYESTDGPAGQITYTFTERSDGQILVMSEMWPAGATKEGTYVEEVGVFDPGRGRWTAGEPSFLVDERVSAKIGQQVPFYGPKNSSVGRSHINDWMVRGEQQYRDHWTVWRVIDDWSVEHFYDKKTGILVGRRWVGIGVETLEWLTHHENLRVRMAPPPPANRAFTE